jgi:Spy/CpxP family protein refolding chaperone
MSTKFFAIVLIAASFSTAALAQEAPAGRVFHFAQRRLNMTQQQREQARTILLQEQPKLQRLRQNLIAERTEMTAASSGGSFDPATAKAVAAKYAEANADAAVERAKLRAELLSILTPEQQKKLTHLRARISAVLGEGLGDTL